MPPPVPTQYQASPPPPPVPTQFQAAAAQPTPYAPPGSVSMAPPKKGVSIGKILLTIVGVIVGLFMLLVVIGLMLPDTGVTEGPQITDRVDPETQAPIGEPKTALSSRTDLIYASVEVDVTQGQTLMAKWYYTDMHQSHLDVSLPVDRDFKGWASFQVSNGGQPWPLGPYRVEVYVDGEKAAETKFNVHNQ